MPTKRETLFSYVVEHDLGFAPNPSSRYCTLVHCKFGGVNGRYNIVELAEVGDWVLGTGGSNKSRSAGHGKIIYLMRVDEKPSFAEFLTDRRFRGRRDCKDWGSQNTFALISRRYFYFGKNAVDISELSSEFAAKLEKSGPYFRRDYPPAKLKRLVEWFERHYKIGMHGDPWMSEHVSIQPRKLLRCKPRIQAKN
jgi:hypothetical protein